MQINIRQKGVDLPSVQHEGQRWLLAPPKGKYQIVLYNNSSNRRLAVVTVDGLSVLDGEEGTREGNGYVLEPWQTLEIKGWRRSDTVAAAFKFTPNGGSYSAQVGKGTRNTGVIACSVFDEKVAVPDPVVIQRFIQQQPIIIELPIYIQRYPWPYPMGPYAPGIYCGQTIGTSAVSNTVHDGSSVQCSVTTSSTMDSAPVQTELASMDLGTAYGKEVAMRTQTTTFVRASKKPALETVIRYGTSERLAALGVPVERASVTPLAPNPFPGSACPAPPGWGG